MNEKKHLIPILFLFLLASLWSGCQVATPQPTQEPTKATPLWPTNDWPVSFPEDQGIDPEKLQRMFAIIDEFPHLEIHSVLIIRKGYIVAERYYPPYSETKKNALFSCTKSVISALIGIAINEGSIKGVNQPVLDYFPDQLSANPDPLKNQMTLEDLLTMRSGLEWHEGNAEYQGMYTARDWIGFVLKKPMISEPRSQFNYCSGCSHVLSGVIRASTGMTTQDFAKSRLFTPLGIKDFYWELDTSGNAIGGWGLELTARDMAKFGYLYLHNGIWEDKMIISTEWIIQSTQMQVKSSDKWGYGYHWWVKPATRTFAAQGLHGQQIYVIPEQEMVIVVTAGKDDGAVLGDLVFNTAISAIR